MARALQETELVVNSLKAYLRLCVKSNSRSVVLKDSTFLRTLSVYVGTENPTIMTYIVKILLTLTESKDDAVQLAAIPDLEASIGRAADRTFPPTILHNLLVVSSRIRSAKNSISKSAATSIDPQAETGTMRKKLFGKSKQAVFDFDDLDPEQKSDIESKLLRKKGVVSVYFTKEGKRIVVRTILSIEITEIANIIFDCGCEMISQVITIDGHEEHFPMYASERQIKDVALPDYLDDMIDSTDPKARIVTNEYAQSQPGWFSGFSSLVKGVFW